MTASAASAAIVRVLAVGLEELEVGGHDGLDGVWVLDAEPGEGAPLGLRGSAQGVVALQHADLIDGERARPVRQRQREQRAKLGGPEGERQIEALALGPLLNPVQELAEGDDLRAG